MTGPRLGIMGGTFDPIHTGHLLAAEGARWHVKLDEVVFVPTGQPWQKPVVVADPEDRYRMTELAIASNPAFSVSRVELDQPGPTYTVETLRRLRAGLPDGGRLFLILGADVILQLPSWKDPGEVIALAELVAVSRPGYDLGGLQAALAATLQESAAGAAGAGERGPVPRLHTVPIPQLAISSTDVRTRVAAGVPIRYLTPDPVVDYIAEHGLYRAAPGEPAEPGEREARRS
jgi:nicotinate-nucleotide adenylyltransferase